MRTLFGRSLLLLVLAPQGCAAPGPDFAAVAPSLPPLPQGEARIFAYRWLEPYDTLSWTRLYLNGQPNGMTEPGSMLYRDVPPGQYTISVDSDEAFQNQFKTVALAPGQTAYVRIESLGAWPLCEEMPGCYGTFTVNLVNPAAASAEMQHLRFIPG